MNAQPKQQAEVKTRTKEDRESFRLQVASGQRSDADARDLPWDPRGPPGPRAGGPDMWMGQKYRENIGRWANGGGRHKEKYALFRKKQREGITGKDLNFWHPFAKDGHWAKQAKDAGVMAPWEEKEAETLGQ